MSVDPVKGTGVGIDPVHGVNNISDINAGVDPVVGGGSSPGRINGADMGADRVNDDGTCAGRVNGDDASPGQHLVGLVDVSGLTVEFGDVRAVDGLSFTLAEGAALGLVG